MRNRLSTVELQIGKTTPSGTTQLSSNVSSYTDVAQLDTRLQVLEANVAGLSNSQTSGTLSSGGSGISSSDMNSVMKQLNDRIKAVENYKGDRFDCPKGSFGSPHDVEQYVNSTLLTKMSHPVELTGICLVSW
mmetsp:Transcript_30291/g.45888  ORF Transcript_30291/g.45888 Transcript_30291/m.45888 type:complete len:133 (-) Transcript_30291:439-837(-)